MRCVRVFSMSDKSLFAVRGLLNCLNCPYLTATAAPFVENYTYGGYYPWQNRGFYDWSRDGFLLML